jgi:hypothetical protein
MPVFAIGRTNSGMFASRASAAGVQRTDMGLGGANFAGSLGGGDPPSLKRRRWRRPLQLRRGRSARRVTGRPVSRRRW